MPTIIWPLICGYLADEFASADANYDWNSLKTKAKGVIESLIKYKIVDDILEKAVDSFLDALAVVLKQQAGVKAVLVGLATSDKAAFVVAIKALVAPQLPAEVAALLAAA